MRSEASASSSASRRLRSASRAPAQIEAFEIEQVEGIVGQPVLAARGEVGVKEPEIGDAVRIRRHDFAVHDQVRCREGCERIGHPLKAQRPIIACAGVDGRLAVSQVRSFPVAVELDLVHPALA